MDVLETGGAPETKVAPLELKAGGQAGAFAGYGAVFGNRDDGGDIIEQGAFKSLRDGGDVVMILRGHDPNKIIGEATFKQDARGLKLDGQLYIDDDDIPLARETYALMKRGRLKSMSVGFSIPKGGSKWSDDGAERTISKAELWEVSIVPFGMNRKAKITSVKTAAIATVDWRGLEADLRKHHSRSEALAIVALCKTYLSDSGADVPSDSERQASETLELRQYLAEQLQF